MDLVEKVEDEETQIQALIKQIETIKGPESKDAWFNLGCYYLNNEAYNEAIKCFQTCLRFDNTDDRCRQCIAEAYYHRGSYLAAINVFGLALKRCTDQNDKIYILVRIAESKQKLGRFNEAVVDYQQILQIQHDYVPAIVALAQTKLMIAKLHFKQFHFVNGHNECEQALNICLRAVYQRPDLCTCWKLSTDIMIVMCLLGKNNFHTKLIINNQVKHVDKSQLTSYAIKFACQGIVLKPNSSIFWYNLALSHYLRIQDESNMTKQYDFDMAIKCLLKALSIDSTNYQFWNTLGVIAVKAKNHSIAQHCFIKSIQLNKSTNEVPWNNLGILYFQKNNIQLPHKALCRSQSEEPSFVNCWIGLSLIAAQVKHEETLDLLKHCNDIGNHPQGQIAFANYYFTNCKNQLEFAFAVMESLIKYIKWNDNCFMAYYNVGAISERQNNQLGALIAYYKSLKKCDKNAKYYKKMSKNYDRILSKVKSHEKEALKPIWLKLFDEKVH